MLKLYSKHGPRLSLDGGLRLSPHHGSCFRYFFNGCDQIPDKNNLGEERFILVHALCVQTLMMGKAWGWEHLTLATVEARRLDIHVLEDWEQSQDRQWNQCINLKAYPLRAPLPLARLCFSKVL